ncbi:MAG: cyclic nucleotide-binding domain-containing protein [Myxococcaceae bacterium]|nr:cyclic nucleotide-binding domain-containing protein [Myxococcaceae bacterium]
MENVHLGTFSAPRGDKPTLPQSFPPRGPAHRIAVPIPAAEAKPSLIPTDIMKDWQREVADAEHAEEAQALEYEVESVSDSDIEAISSAQELPAANSDEDVHYSTQEAADPEVAMRALAEVRLFHGLPEASLRGLASGSLQVHVPEGEHLFLEGDPADSFYVVIEGAVEILRRREEREVALRHFGPGEPIGLFGLFSGQQRAASARAIGDVVLLEVPCDALQFLVEKDDALHDRLLRFYQERLLEGFMGGSRLFTDVDSIARARLIGRFKERVLEANETLSQPGEVSNMIAVVTHGKLLLEGRSQAGQAPKQLEVTQGQFLAVMGALSGLPSKLRIFAPSQTVVLMLSHKELTDLMKDYPALRALPNRFNAHAKALDRDVFAGHTGVPGL